MVKKLRRYVKPFASDIVTLRTDGQADIYKQICYINIARQSADARLSYMVCRTAQFSMTLNDPKPRFQGQAIA